eukprot:TRINITY_DN1026_c0_g1_i9.p2 TRINITY_DN1026_c0_g1~~TRINITY_DN1026_c0_g1_i9.p2  ORF type:complete len:121 (+),score=7.43 TRINITY_DN1026_c0_g1_i9:705-1067(+)
MCSASGERRRLCTTSLQEEISDDGHRSSQTAERVLDYSAIEEWFKLYSGLLQQHHYHPSLVFNADETYLKVPPLSACTDLWVGLHHSASHDSSCKSGVFCCCLAHIAIISKRGHQADGYL